MIENVWKCLKMFENVWKCLVFGDSGVGVVSGTIYIF